MAAVIVIAIAAALLMYACCAVAGRASRAEERRAYTRQECSYPAGVTVKPDGVHEAEPHMYELAERHKNVTVEVLRCKHCGKVSIGWYRQDNTEDEG